MNINKIKLICLVLFSFICLCIGLTSKTLQNDTFYMIKLGEYIVKNGIDLKDHWVWISNLPYTYPHWLYDVFIYFIYNFFGYFGIYVSTIISFFILGLVYYYVIFNINKNRFLSLFLSIVNIIVVSVIAAARAQVFSYILFVLEIFYLFKLINCGDTKYLIYLFIISVLIANIHATVWLFYFILYFPFFGEQFIYMLKKKYKFKINAKIILDKVNNFNLLITSFVLSFLGGLLSPSRICYTYVFRIMLGDSQLYISEHSPLIVIQNPLFLGIILVLLIVLIFTKTRIKLSELFMITGLIFMSLLSTRHVIFFYLIGGLFISIIIMRYFYEYRDYSLDILYNIIMDNNIIYIFVLVIIFICSLYNFNNNFKYDYVDEKKYPVAAVKYIKSNLDYKNIKLFNTYNYGSYIMLNDIPIFIDSRCDLYLKEFNGKNLDIFDEVVNINSGYKKIFDKYGVEYALIKNNEYLYQLLIKDIDNILYEDEYFTLFKIS